MCREINVPDGRGSHCQSAVRETGEDGLEEMKRYKAVSRVIVRKMKDADVFP